MPPILAALLLLALTPNPLATTPQGTGDPGLRGDTLRAFATEAEFAAFLRRHAPPRARREALQLQAAAPMAEMAVTGVSADAVTNVQHAGVDEGGIVKVHGDHLVILRRGRLFTVRVGDAELRPVSAEDAFGPDVDPQGTWYDELIIHDDAVVVVGYSYARGGTEIGLFSIDRDGRLRHRSTYQLRSNDYYSSRNYASRLIGSRLVFYAPVRLPTWGEEPFSALPAVRRWAGQEGGAGFRRILPASRVYYAELPHEPGSFVLHTVTICDLARGELSCDARAVAGPHGRVFYVSPTAVYVWTTRGRRGAPAERSPSMLYRLPLDGSAPAALRVAGSPVDQFSFLEGDDGYLNVLVRSAAAGDWMWSAERADGDVALLRAPLASFSDGTRAAPGSSYRPLPAPEAGTFQNRFVHGHILYGSGSGWHHGRRERAGTLYVAPLRGGPVVDLELGHGIDRIEVMGRNAVAVGVAGDDLYFSSIVLDRGPAVADRYRQERAAQGELRSHGFFYRADGPDGGVLGLPVREAGRPGYVHLREGSAAVLFLRTERARFRPLGRLQAEPEVADDACRASCVDWYGNTRPLFLRGRVLALLGYELVEGRIEQDRLREVRRVSFAPGNQRRRPADG